MLLFFFRVTSSAGKVMGNKRQKRRFVDDDISAALADAMRTLEQTEFHSVYNRRWFTILRKQG